MKKLLFIIALFTFSLAQSQNLYKVSGASFDTINAVQSGSQQWVDVTCDIPYPNTFTVYYINLINLDSTSMSRLLIYQTANYFDSIQPNIDGSKRIYFDVPWDSPTGYFAIITNLISDGVALGKVTNATPIKNLTLTPTTNTKPFTYTNLLGQTTTELKGLLIRNDRKLIYFE